MLSRARRYRPRAQAIVVLVYAILLVVGLLLSAYTPPVTAFETSPVPYQGMAITRSIGVSGEGFILSIQDDTGYRVVTITSSDVTVAEAPYPEAGTICEGNAVIAAVQYEPYILLIGQDTVRQYSINTSVILPRAKAAACIDGRAAILYSPFVTGPSFILILDPENPEDAQLYRIPGQAWRWITAYNNTLYLAADDRIAVIQGEKGTIYDLPENLTIIVLQPSDRGPIILGYYEGRAALVFPSGDAILLDYPDGDDPAESIAYTDSERGWISLLVRTPQGGLQYVQVHTRTLEAVALDIIIGGAWTRQAAIGTLDGTLMFGGTRIKGENKTLFMVLSEGAVGVPVVVGWPDYILLVKKTLNQPTVYTMTIVLEEKSTFTLENVDVYLIEEGQSQVTHHDWARIEEPHLEYTLILFTAVSLTIPVAYAACRALCTNGLIPSNTSPDMGPPPADTRGPREQAG